MSRAAGNYEDKEREMVGDHRSPGVHVGSVSSFALTAFLVCIFSFSTGVAQAAPKTIAGPGSGAGQVDFPVSTAADQASGDVYVADSNNNRIDKFDSDGRFLLSWGFGVRDGVTAELQTCGPQATLPQSYCFKSEFVSNDGAGNVTAPVSVAVDQASGSVLVADEAKRRITKFTPSGQFVFLVGSNVNATKVAEGGATQAEKNICTAASGDTCTSGASGSGANEFMSPRSLAVTPAGVVWVGDIERLVSFDASGVPGTEILLSEFPGNTQSLAMNSAGDFYVKSQSLPGIRKLAGPGALVPGELLETLDATGEARTVTLDGDDNVYIGDATSPYRFMKFNPAGEQLYQFGAGEVIGSPGYPFASGANALAIGENAAALYVASSDPPNSAVQRFPLPESGPLIEEQNVEGTLPTSTTLTARINPENDNTTYRFEYGTSEGYGQSTPQETLSASGFEGEGVEAHLAGLVPETTYHFRVTASNHCNLAEPADLCTAIGEDRAFTTLPAVAIDPQWTTEVTAHTAQLHAELNPLGVEAEAWLEYGTDEGYGQVIPFANLGNGFGAVARQADLAGLQAGTTYHFRFAARDERDGVIYSVHGRDSTFITQQGGIGFELADGRAWEMVSPPNKHGALLIGGGINQLQASADGEGIAYPSRLSTEEDPEGNRILNTSMNLADRESTGFWHSKDITPPNDRVTGAVAGESSEYKLFSPDLSESLVSPFSGTPLSPEASEKTPYLRQNVEPPAWTPLVTGKEPGGNVPPGIEFGGRVTLAGVSAEFTHFALSSDVPLVEGALPSPSTLYEWSGGQLKPVSVLPPVESGTLVGNSLIGSGSGSVRGALSNDGSRVFWSRKVAGEIGALYVRDTETGESVRLDLKQPGASGIGTAQPIFQAASADGTVVFFTDSQQLTEDATPSGFDLYRCELSPGDVASGCATLTDISVSVSVGERAEVEGIAAGATADGQTIYFVARGVLDEEPNQYGDGAISGQPNLYVWQQGEGARFIATLADEDKNDWGGFSPIGKTGRLSAVASPSGRYLAFMSQRSLTGYDNRDASTDEPAQEVYRYDAIAGQLRCASCNPTGARPRSGTPSQAFGSLVDPEGRWEGYRTAATLPGATSVRVGEISLYQPRVMLDNGRVFFNAIDPLVAADSNGQWDAYQYETVGVGDCTASSSNALGGGCISLISSGTGESEAAFFDASTTGDDAFFWTPAQLNETDVDHEVDIYDARVGGIPATLPKITECLGEACQPTVPAPNDPTPASASFEGAGNVHPAAKKHCPKGKHKVRRHGRTRCVIKKHKGRRSHKTPRKASTDRRVEQ